MPLTNLIELNVLLLRREGQALLLPRGHVLRQPELTVLAVKRVHHVEPNLGSMIFILERCIHTGPNHMYVLLLNLQLQRVFKGKIILLLKTRYAINCAVIFYNATGAVTRDRTIGSRFAEVQCKSMNI
jgi:hypothetical protein